MANEFLTRLATEIEETSPEMAVCTPEQAVYAPHEGGFPRRKQ
jgi:hypothetical protein